MRKVVHPEFYTSISARRRRDSVAGQCVRRLQNNATWFMCHGSNALMGSRTKNIPNINLIKHEKPQLLSPPHVLFKQV